VAAGIAGIAGWVPVAWKAKVGPGDRVLVLGGTGAVGRIAAQAAELLGAEVVLAVGRSELGRIAEEFGDDGFTVCIDPVWGQPLADALAHAAPHARIVHVGQSAGPESPLRSADVRGKELTIMGHSNFQLSAEERRRAQLELLEHMTAGSIELPIERYPLDRAAEAWERQRSGPGGKVVIEF
jgi:NADPH2:quinone reductase